jgi:hypothetical protein
LSEHGWVANGALAIAALWVFGLGVTTPTGFGQWLTAIAVLPALAFLANAPPATRLALRFLVPIAILQMLHACPAAGAQRWWATVMIFVPCSIALGTAARELPAWTSLAPAARRVGVGALCVVVVFLLGLWPYGAWRTYLRETPLDLPGTRLVRLDRGFVSELRDLTHAVKQHCDTLYSAPGFDSLYVFTGLEPPTGQLRNWPGAHSRSQQKQIADDLARAEDAGTRVCIVRDTNRIKEWVRSSYGRGPLGAALAPYRRQVAKVANFTVSIKGSTSSTSG